MSRLLLPVTVLAFTLNFVGCAPKTETKPAAPAKVEAKVKAGDLLKAYSSNVIAADDKYKGKVIQVSGKFGAVQNAPLYGPTIQLLSDDAGDISTSNILCVITSEARADAGKLKEGDAITIQGQCDGQVLGQVKMTKCTVVK